MPTRPRKSFVGHCAILWWRSSKDNSLRAAMKLFVFWVLGLFLGIGLAHADLLENYDQLRQRYGDPVSHTVSDDGTLFTLYRWSPFCVLVGFLQGCSHHEAFKRLDGAPMTATDMEKCLPFEKWKKVSGRTWEYQGRTALAGYSVLKSELRIYSGEWGKRHGAYSPVSIEAWLATAGEGN